MAIENDLALLQKISLFRIMVSREIWIQITISEVCGSLNFTYIHYFNPIVDVHETFNVGPTENRKFSDVVKGF